MTTNAMSKYPLTSWALLLAVSMATMYFLIWRALGHPMSAHFIAFCCTGGAVISLMAFFYRYAAVSLMLYAALLYFGANSADASPEMKQLSAVFVPMILIGAAGVAYGQLKSYGASYFLVFDKPSWTDAAALLAVASIPLLLVSGLFF